MTDWTATIIDYRGGKALLLDSLDIMHLASVKNISKAIREIEAQYSEVDYILLLTSFHGSTLRPQIRAMFEGPMGSRINCFRRITEKGKQTWNNYLEDQIKEFHKIVEEGPQ